MDTEINPIESAKNCLKNRQSFVMQGGAGSGKTETLKDLLQYLSYDFPAMTVACITHTNLAANEIKSRVGEKYSISTIHSFLHDIIKDYKRNIKTVIGELFTVPLVERGVLRTHMLERDYNKFEHEKYKKVHEKYSDKLYSVKNEKTSRYTGKRDYDKDPIANNQHLNNRIEVLNNEILEIISKFDYSKIKYNNTRFNSFKDLSYGHDGLLVVTYALFKKYPVLNKILCDKFDYIFIDEYQDTRKEIIDIFLSLPSAFNVPTICLFGDTMQSIYKDGIGDAVDYIKNEKLKYISKKDNYRCSDQVLQLINSLRIDGLEQKVAFKKDINGTLETLSERQGKVQTLYTIYDSKPNAYSGNEIKEAYYDAIDKLISTAQLGMGEHKILLLTNKAISKKVGFPSLYKIFNDRYSEVGDRMDEQLKTMQVTDLCELIYYYVEKQYNHLISAIKPNGFIIRKASDKQQLSKNIERLFDEDISIIEALELAFELKLLKKSERYVQLANRRLMFIKEIKYNKRFQEFKSNYENGFNTFPRMRDKPSDFVEEEFKELESVWKRERYYDELYSENIKFSETLKYYNYVNEGTQYITMHKTKGSGIDSVLVVIDEYFWNNEYDFSLIYSDNVANQDKKFSSQKIIYVACSRAITNLTCIRMISSEEEKCFLKCFPSAEKIG